GSATTAGPSNCSGFAMNSRGDPAVGRTPEGCHGRTTYHARHTPNYQPFKKQGTYLRRPRGPPPDSPHFALRRLFCVHVSRQGRTSRHVLRAVARHRTIYVHATTRTDMSDFKGIP